MLKKSIAFSFCLTRGGGRGKIRKKIVKGDAFMDNRTSKQNYYLDIADSVLERSTCLRRKYGAIIVRNDEIISTGYNGAPRGRRNCTDLGFCNRENLHIPSGERY